HTASDAPIRKSRFGINSVSADALVAPISSTSAIAHPSPNARFRSDRLLIYPVSIDSTSCGIGKRRPGQALQEIGQMVYSDFIGVWCDLPTWRTLMGRL